MKKIQTIRQNLPVYAHKDQLLKAIKQYQILIVVGETGSGKTTQIPQFLYEAAYHLIDEQEDDNVSKKKKTKKKNPKKWQIGCTQPRRVAAMSVANRVANEMNVKLGQEVGYTIRFEDNTSDKTIIKYMTDGMLLREFIHSPTLSNYSIIIIDEAHERTLQTDILFALLKDVCKIRPNFKLILSSATVNAKKFSDYFNQAAIYQIPGRTYPIDVYYTQTAQSNYIQSIIMTILQIHLTQQEEEEFNEDDDDHKTKNKTKSKSTTTTGDILVFLTGQEDIELCHKLLVHKMNELKQFNKAHKPKSLLIVPIYSSLPSELQARIFIPTPINTRKVILATNIAETSLTVHGIKYVIDAGLCKMKVYNPVYGIESLLICPISKASANQRKGRAGRTNAGKCFRLYTYQSYVHDLNDITVPEIQRCNLNHVVLLLKSLGINDLIHFDFIDPPAAEVLIHALEQLYALQALNQYGQLTKLGRKMAELPLDPKLSKLLLTSNIQLLNQLVTIVSMLSISHQNLFYIPNNKIKHQQAKHIHQSLSHEKGDHLTLLRVYLLWAKADYTKQWCYDHFIQYKTLKNAYKIRNQLVGLLSYKFKQYHLADFNVKKIIEINDIKIRKILLSAYFDHCAMLTNTGQYQILKTKQYVYIHPSSSLSLQSLPATYLFYFQLVKTSKEYMRQVSQIDQIDWLFEIAPHYYKKKDLLK